MILRRGTHVNRNAGGEMAQKRKTVHLSPRLVYLSALPTGLGVLKVYSRYFSRFRYGLLDYLFAAGAILGGVFLFSQKPSKVILLISGSFIVGEVFKAIVDRHDIFEVSIAIIAIIYLSIPPMRFVRERVAQAC